MILWRSFFSLTASRYCSSFIVYLIILSSTFYCNSVRNKGKIAFLGIACISLYVYNGLETKSSFRNVYIVDIVETLQRYAPSYSGSRIFTSYKEFNRLNVLLPGEKRIFKTENYSFQEIADKYSFSGYNLLLIENNTSRVDAQVIYPETTRFRMISKFNTNAKKNKWIPIYQFFSQELPLYNPKFSHKVNNLISNGDIERVLPRNQNKRLLGDWISQGVDFYDSDDIHLPQFNSLFQTWKQIDDLSYPRVYVDSDNVLSGSHSLHIILPKNNVSNIYFSNRIKTTEGTLSFLVKAFSQSEILVSRYDFIPPKHGTTPPFSTFVYRINPNNTYKIMIPLRKETIEGTESVYYLYGKNVDILIDDIEFSPQQSNL